MFELYVFVWDKYIPYGEFKTLERLENVRNFMGYTDYMIIPRQDTLQVTLQQQTGG